MLDKKRYGLVSFPKCGRTWVRLFLEYYKRNSETKIKQQLIFRHIDEFEFKKRILLIRHPCDVMVSFHFHRTVRTKMDLNIHDFIRHPQCGIPAFNDVYKKWSKRQNNQLIVRYEDMFNESIWIDILNFLDIPIYEKAFDVAIENTKFDTIKKNIADFINFPSAWRYLAAERGNYNVIYPTNPNAHKFRRGKIGEYIHHLSNDDINYILENFTLGENLEEYKKQYIMMSGQWHQTTIT
jgi:hypothetical protein